MAAADTSAVGLAVQIAQLHHDGVSAKEIQGSLQSLCMAQGLDDPTAQVRVQEAFHIWTTMSSALRTTGLGESTAPSTTENPVSERMNSTEQPPAWLATLLAAIQPTNAA